MKFVSGFEKVAGDGWSNVGALLSELPDLENPKVGDRVAYACEIKWTNEPDGKHAGGGWDGYDFSTDGVTIGSTGVIKEVEKGNRIKVAWDKHQYDDKKKNWVHSYRISELKKLKPRPERK